jgi:hypothetical protein
MEENARQARSSLLDVRQYGNRETDSRRLFRLRRAAGIHLYNDCDICSRIHAYVLIYKRTSPRDVLLSLGIAAAGFGAGIWISFAYLDADSRLSALPILVGVLVASGADALIRKRFRKA